MRAGLSSSCGCLKRDVTHGNAKPSEALKRFASRSATYYTWRAMKARCYDPKCRNYPHYGARGIRVCQKWLDSFTAFLDDMGTRPDGMTIDRKRNDGDYEPGNCRWVDVITQARNKRNNRVVVFGGITACVAEWSERTGLSKQTILDRLNSGWSAERALTESINENLRRSPKRVVA